MKCKRAQERKKGMMGSNKSGWEVIRAEGRKVGTGERKEITFEE
jgi:hypothetical protein